MLNRKVARTSALASRSSRADKRQNPAKSPVARRRFVLPSAKRKAPPGRLLPAKPNNNAKVEPPKPETKAWPTSQQLTALTNPNAGSVDLTETIKTLLHLAQEHGHVTYDDINDVLPDGLTPEDLDELYTKLRNLDVEIVDQAEVERAKPAGAGRGRGLAGSKSWTTRCGCT